MDEALEDDVLVASGAGVVDAPEAIGSTWSRNGIGTDNLWVFFDGFCKKFIILSFASCAVLVGRMARAAEYKERLRRHGRLMCRCQRNRERILENVPESIFLFLRSSRVGSQTKSSHIWQYREPVLDSTTG